MLNATQKEYFRRINLALEYIDAHLDEALSLEKIAGAAFFSPFHFHRIFSAIVGESPADYARRLRLEKAAARLRADPCAAVTEIALECGFSSPSLFSRSFRERFGLTPQAWRSGNSKKSTSVRKNRKAAAAPFRYTEDGNSRKRRQHMEKQMKDRKVEVTSLEELTVAYVLQKKGYDIGGICNAYGKLFAWAGPRGLVNRDTKVIGIGADNPDVTPGEKCRYYACIAVPAGTAADGEIGVMKLPAGKYAVSRFEGGEDIIKKAYDFMYGGWLPANGYQPADSHAYEVYLSTPDKSENRRYVFDLCVPVRPL